MNLFEQIVDSVLLNRQDHVILRPAVEKEILHQDILRTLSKAGLFQKLTFMGGTCLRACYGFSRLSENLDFSGGFDFKIAHLKGIGDLLKTAIVISEMQAGLKSALMLVLSLHLPVFYPVISRCSISRLGVDCSPAVAGRGSQAGRFDFCTDGIDRRPRGPACGRDRASDRA